MSIYAESSEMKVRNTRNVCYSNGSRTKSVVESPNNQDYSDSNDRSNNTWYLDVLRCDSKCTKIDSSMVSTYMTDLDTIYEEESVCESASEWLDESFMVRMDSTPRFKLSKTSFSESSKCLLDLKQYKTSKSLKVTDKNKFENNLPHSDQMAALWKRCLKSGPSAPC